MTRASLPRLAQVSAAALLVMSTAVPAVAQAPNAAAPNAKAILADLDKYIPKALAEWNGVGIAVGIVSGDSLIYAKGFGVREVGKSDPVDDRTLFAIGSNSKFFTAVSAGILQDEGKLSLDDKVTKYLPWFQLYDPWVTREFTLRDAMSHRSGLGRRGDALWYGTPFSRDEIVRRVRYMAPNSSFRTEFGYQNIMFLTAGQALAAAAGKSWDDVVREKIFVPLGMTASSTTAKAIVGAPNVASAHNLDAGATKAEVIPFRDIDNVAPAGSIISNVQDMARWMRMINAGGTFGGKTIIKPTTLADITGPHTIATRVVNDTLNPSRHFSLYALGIGVSDLLGVKVLQHTGGIDGMLSYVAMVPERKLGIVVLTNVTGHNALYTALGSRILSSFLGGPTRDMSAIALAETNKAEARMAEMVKKRMAEAPADARPSHSLADYAGTYRSEMYGDLTVSMVDGGLVLFYPNAVDLTLRPFNYDTFVGTPRGSKGLLDRSVVRFSLDQLGRIASVEVEEIDTFKRVKESK